MSLKTKANRFPRCALHRESVFKRLLLIVTLCTCGFAQKPDLTGVRILTHRLSDNIYMLEATGDVAGNIAVLVGPEGILLVDSQFPELSEGIRSSLEEIQPGTIEYIINTHYHVDHSGGNEVLKDPGTRIVASENTKIRASKWSHEARPIITFDSALTIHFNGEEIKLFHLPNGHTDTDVVVFFTKSRILHLGDLYNAGISSFPNVDLEAGGTLTGLIKNIGMLVEIIPEDAKIIPGHYELSDLDGLKACHQMLIDTIGFVKMKKKAGATLQQIKEEGFPAQYESWGQTGYTDAEEWIDNIYRGLDNPPVLKPREE